MMELARNIFLHLWFREIIKSNEANAILLSAIYLDEDATKSRGRLLELADITEDVALRSQILQRRIEEMQHAEIVKKLFVELGWETHIHNLELSYFTHFFNILEEHRNMRKTIDPVVEFWIWASLFEEKSFSYLQIYKNTLRALRPDLIAVVAALAKLEADEIHHVSYSKEVLHLYNMTPSLSRVKRFYLRLARQASKRWLCAIVPELKLHLHTWRFSVLSFFLLLYAKTGAYL